MVVRLFTDSQRCYAGPVMERHPPGSPYSMAGSKTRFDRDALVLIINRDAKPIKEAHQPKHLPGHGAWETFEFGNRHGCIPGKAVNLHPHDMQIGLEASHRSTDVNRIPLLPREPEIRCPRPLQDTIGSGAIHPEDEVGRPFPYREGDGEIDTADMSGIGAILEGEGGVTHESYHGPWATCSSSTVLT